MKNILMRTIVASFLLSVMVVVARPCVVVPTGTAASSASAAQAVESVVAAPKVPAPLAAPKKSMSKGSAWLPLFTRYPRIQKTIKSLVTVSLVAAGTFYSLKSMGKPGAYPDYKHVASLIGAAPMGATVGYGCSMAVNKLLSYLF